MYEIGSSKEINKGGVPLVKTLTIELFIIFLIKYK